MAKRGTKFMAPQRRRRRGELLLAAKGGEGQRLEWQRLEEVTNSKGLCRMPHELTGKRRL